MLPSGPQLSCRRSLVSSLLSVCFQCCYLFALSGLDHRRVLPRALVSVSSSLVSWPSIRSDLDREHLPRSCRSQAFAGYSFFSASRAAVFSGVAPLHCRPQPPFGLPCFATPRWSSCCFAWDQLSGRRPP